ncbi:hypothetical protein RvY_04847 [Ramazzottius varieornatus]|uniref:Uncharacterized protein n=1 Tax=Ramazzottius varieornatus TaxID=947166 RepID=A0A1D1UT03_RAMVA|nr:hypothetical protein RvY_04847 [Ramazzottius varieornatus]
MCIHSHHGESCFLVRGNSPSRQAPSGFLQDLKHRFPMSLPLRNRFYIQCVSLLRGAKLKSYHSRLGYLTSNPPEDPIPYARDLTAEGNTAEEGDGRRENHQGTVPRTIGGLPSLTPNVELCDEI